MAVDFSIVVEADLVHDVESERRDEDFRTKCVHEEMGVVDRPQSSVCANGRGTPGKLIVDLIQKVWRRGMYRRVATWPVRRFDTGKAPLALT